MRLISFIILSAAATGLAAPLSLPELIERARANDHRVKESQAQLRFFKAKYDEARWAWFPRIDSYLLLAGPTPEAKNDALGGPPLTEATKMYDLNFGQPGVTVRASAEAVLPIYTFGKLDALEAAGAKGVEAGEALLRRAKDEAEFQVSQAYYGYTFAAESKQVVTDTMKKLEEAEGILKRLREEKSDQVTQMDVYKLAYYRKQAEVQIAAAESGSQYALAAIRLLVNAKPGEPLEIATDGFPKPEGQLQPIDAYVNRAMEARPELRAILAGIGAREQEVIIREAQYYPDFGIAGFARWAWTTNATRQLSPFAYDPYNELNGGVGLVMRYQWDFPQKAFVLEQARAELQKMQHQRDLLRAGVALEIEKTWNETKAAITKVELQSVAEANARRWALAAFQSFDLGTGDTRELVDAFVALATASAMHVQALHDVQVGLRALTRSVGEPVTLEAPAPVAPPPAQVQPR